MAPILFSQYRFAFLSEPNSKTLFRYLYQFLQGSIVYVHELYLLNKSGSYRVLIYQAQWARVRPARHRLRLQARRAGKSNPYRI